MEAMVSGALAEGTLSEDALGDLISNATRLVDPDSSQGGMGRHFKVLCVVSDQLANHDILPFNIPDQIMALEEQETNQARSKARAASVMGGSSGDANAASQQQQQQLPYADPLPAASEHVFSTPPPEPKPTVSTGTAASTTQRRAAAREAAAELARARVAREAATAAAKQPSS